MPNRDCALPFPRGQFASNAGAITMTEAMFEHLEGKIFEVEDTVHNTGRTIKLRVVKNETGADVTVARVFAEFSDDAAYEFGGVIEACPADTAGAVVKPVDDAYTVGVTWRNHDLAYVVEEGPCNCTTEASSVSLSAGDAVATDATGFVNGAECAAGEYPVGVLDAASTTAAEAVVIHINAGLAKPPAA